MERLLLDNRGPHKGYTADLVIWLGQLDVATGHTLAAHPSP